MPMGLHAGDLAPDRIVPSQARTAALTSSRQSGMVTPAIGRKVILVISCLYGQDGTDVRACCGALRAGLSDRCATTWQDRKYHYEGF